MNDDSSQRYLDRREKLKEQGKFELPLNIDKRKYIIGNLAYFDLLIVSPVLIPTAIIGVILFKMQLLTQVSFLILVAPLVTILMLQFVKHPTRKNISILQYKVLWKIKYNRSQKEFQYKRGAIDLSQHSEDIRGKLGIKNIFKGTYETTDKRYVKILRVSSVNLDLMNKNEQESVISGYSTYLNELDQKAGIQVARIAQPVNLNKYLIDINEKHGGHKNPYKHTLLQGYLDFGEDLQKSRQMVMRERYVVLSQPIGSDDKKAMDELNREIGLQKMNIENMLSGQAQLRAYELDNDDLKQLIYTCLDYDSAQVFGEQIKKKGKDNTGFSMGKETANQLIASLQAMDRQIH